MELASPAADWIPCGTQTMAGFPPRTKVYGLDRFGGTNGPWDSDNSIGWGDVYTHFRLAPAQPAEGEPMFHCKRHGDYPVNESGLCPACQAGDSKYDEWHPTSQLPNEGRVVELRGLSKPADADRGIVRGGKFLVGNSKQPRDDSWEPLYSYEWRHLPPGERAETTINATQEMTPSASRVLDSAGATPVSRPNSPASAPQRQNLVTQCWKCNETYLMVQRSCPNCLSANANHCYDLAQKQREGKELPPLHRVTVERERIRFLLAYKGRIPMIEPPRVILSNLPVNAFKEWK